VVLEELTVTHCPELAEMIPESVTSAAWTRSAVNTKQEQAIAAHNAIDSRQFRIDPQIVLNLMSGM
jgi:hypothetical protein